jgi:hypothetical protein
MGHRFYNESEKLREKAARVAEQRRKMKQKGVEKQIGKLSSKHKVCEMINIYTDMFNEYYHKPKKFINISAIKITKNHRGYKNYLKAVKLAEKRKLDYKTFLKSQFYWFDRWFNRAPKSHEICGGKGKFPAALRVEKYLNLFGNKNNPTIKSIAIPGNNLNSEELNEVNIKNLENLKQIWGMNSSDVFLNFGVGIESVFNQSWLRRQPAYIDLVRAGQI